MTDIAHAAPRYRVRPADLIHWLVVALGLSALVVSLAVARPQFEAEQQCHRGSFSSEFSSDFDISHCDIVLRKTGSEIGRMRLPQWWTDLMLR